MVQLIGGDPIPVDISKERYVTFPEEVRLSHKTHKQTMDSLHQGKDYFGTNSIHYSSANNGIYIFVVEKSQENIIQSYIKTSLKRVHKQIQIPQVYYLKTTIEAKTKYAIHQITISDKKEMKREMFDEKSETMESFSGLQFSKRFVNIVFATLEFGNNKDFIADEAFLSGIQKIVQDIDGGKKCNEFYCPPPSFEKLAELLTDVPVLKITCTKSECSYKKGGDNKALFTKIPFLQVGKKFRYLDKALNGMLTTSLNAENQPFISITAQLALKCDIKDFDFHSNGYSGAVQSVNLGDSKLYSVLIIEPGYNGIKRKLKTQTPEMYDELKGTEKVKAVYYFMIISNQGSEELFNKIVTTIQTAKENDAKKYQCTIKKYENEDQVQSQSTSFMQLSANLFATKESKQQHAKVQQSNEGEEEYDYEYEYVYEYAYDYDENGYDDSYEYIYQYEELAEEFQDNEDQNIEFDQSTENQESEEQILQAQPDLLEVNQSEICFKAYSECEYKGVSLSICGPNPQIPKGLQNFLIKSMIIPDQMRITFYTNERQRIVIEGDQECLERPFEIDQLK